MEKPVPQQPVSEEGLSDLLREHGIQPTRQRLHIARVLFARAQHLSADQVLERVNTGRHKVSKATVYNTLGLFAREGLVREVIVDPSRIFYDPTTHEHHHFYDVDTGTLTDIPPEQFGIDHMPALPEGTVAEGVDIIVRIRRSAV